MADAHADTHGGEHAPSHMKEYVRTIVTLSVLTIVEFAIAFAMKDHHVGMMLGILVLLALAFVKAVMVARFFMHLKYDPKLLALLAFTPVILAAPFVLVAGFDFARGPNV